METFEIKLSFNWGIRNINTKVFVEAANEAEAKLLAIQQTAVEYGLDESEITVK